MNTRSVIVSLTFVCVLAAFLVWQHLAGQMGSVAIGLIVIGGLIFVALTHFFYRRMWQDDED
jgi:O-antigen ligase